VHCTGAQGLEGPKGGSRISIFCLKYIIENIILNPTHWAGRYMSLLAVKLRYLDIMKALTKINLTCNKKEECDEANRIRKSMSTSEFIFVCVILNEILSQLHLTSKLLQSKNIDLLKAANALQNSYKNLEKLRND